MCTLAIYFKVFPDYPVVIAANRDEYLARPALAPTTLLEHPHVVGGKDVQANGTWLGINQYGLVAGLLNRRRANYGDPNPALRSRGLLCLDALRHKTAAEAAAFVRGQRGTDYNAFNLLVASREEAFVAYLQRYVSGIPEHSGYLDAIGGSRLASLAVSESNLS